MEKEQIIPNKALDNAATLYACDNTGDNPNGLITVIEKAFKAGHSLGERDVENQCIGFARYIVENDFRYLPVSETWIRKPDFNYYSSQELYKIWKDTQK